MANESQAEWDAIIVGSGFGGAMAAFKLVEAGQRVLMLERGSWVARGPANWRPDAVGLRSPQYSMESAYDIRAGAKRYRAGSFNCVGGQSVYYGGASYRFRESDFEHAPDVVGDSGAAWPFRYDDMEPFYGEAETLLNVAGEAGVEPGEPPRSTRFPQSPAALARISGRIAEATARLGLTPSRIPLAIARSACLRCRTCDGFACAAEAKNDLASTIIPMLVRQGMTLRPNTVCTRLLSSRGRVTAVDCTDRVTGQRMQLRARRVILAAGSLATPHLLLASHLETVNPAGDAVGRYLTRHRNACVLGFFPAPPNPEQEFDKQLAIFDYYDRGGCIQQLTPPAALVDAYLPRIMRLPAAMAMTRAAGLLVIAEDEPRAGNRVTIDWSKPDAYGLPRLRVQHTYTQRDNRAALFLAGEAKRILREAGAWATHVHRMETFTHALGTVRMGDDPKTSPLDVEGRFRGTENLYVVDGSALPRSAGVNPSLTIAANALRIGAALVRSEHGAPRRSRRLATIQG